MRGLHPIIYGLYQCTTLSIVFYNKMSQSTTATPTLLDPTDKKSDHIYPQFDLYNDVEWQIRKLKSDPVLFPDTAIS